jgi:fumarate reductase flavoprotein subunit
MVTKTNNLQVDLAIVGGGGAGLAAAIAAAENSCQNILVIEKAGSPGGSTAMAHDVFGAESPVQKRIGIDANRDELFKTAMEWAHWSKINPRIVRAFIDKSGDTIRWLEEKGVIFDLCQFYPNQVPLVRHKIEGNAAEMMRILRENCKSLGIQIITRSRAQKLLRGPGGQVTGVVVDTRDGELLVNAKSIIISTGGYGANKELLQKYCSYYHPETTGYDGPPSNTGDGLIMAMDAGAATAGLGAINFSGPSAIWSAAIRITVTPDKKEPIEITIRSLIWEPRTLWVNKKGVRFMDEGYNLAFFATGNAISQQPEGLSYTLFDSQSLKVMEEQGVVRTGAAGTHLYRGLPPAYTPLHGLEKEIQGKAAEGLIHQSDSWDDIAAWIGARPEVLKSTVAEYNTACDQGHDFMFAKERRYLLPLRTPPYYAIRGNSMICDAYGGIKINENMEVLDHQDEPISGVYAAGTCTGGWETESYCYKLTGHLVGFALNSGRIAGENAARFISKQQ